MTETQAAHRGAGDGAMRVAIANALVGIYKEHYGRGPTAARTFIEDGYIFVVLHDGLTRNELTLIEHGHEKVVREYRLCFNQVMSEVAERAIEEITGRKVLAHHSQVVFDPHMTFEVFVLDGPPGDDD